MLQRDPLGWLEAMVCRLGPARVPLWDNTHPTSALPPSHEVAGHILGGGGGWINGTL